MSNLELKTYVDALLETSSVAAHDISGQVHVMQFCVEELEEHTSDDGRKYLDRLQSSLDELTDIITFYRSYIKKAELTGEEVNAFDLIEKILASVRINFWNEFKKVSFKTDVGSEDWKLSVSCAEVHSVIFSVLAIYLEELKKGQIDEFEVGLTLKKLDSQHCQFTLVSSKPVEKQIFEILDESSSPGAKVVRKNLGHEILLNSPLYKMEVTSTKSNFKVSLNLKVLNE
ncbi:hypothetical protein [Halobacteriovorax sp. JY17]|uniref:hypothetical protein n=1 Tax=Halobacteriovorax sp. JY17 TaxID=2014617 RepID=UPI000C3535FE|nr:hypothetical protein [Halobacteriovorax sp. JY17]PIK16333.1 MAG: hypothetical protein CES88_06220 [Halobacteriovorax sp. JY17]